ncbi:MAG: hypothetical protein ACQETE_06615 [Bacteroidota bacterium]
MQDNYLTDDIPVKNRERAMASYLTMFATTAAGLPLPFLNFIAAYLFHRFVKTSGPFVAFHSYQSMLSQLVVSLINGVAIVWTVVSVINQNFTDPFIAYIVSAGVFNIIYFFISVYAAVKAYKGDLVFFIFFGDMAYKYAFEGNTEVKEQAELLGE